MKKIIGVLMVVVAVAMAMPAQAQIKFGVKGGLNLAKADFDKSDFKTSNFTGFFIGPMVDVTIPLAGLGLDGALMFSQRGIKADGETEKENGIELPINLKYNIGLGSLASVYVAAGPSFFFSFKDDIKIDDNTSWDIKKSQLGINLGAGVKLLKHLQVGVNYQIPVGKTGELTFKDTVTGAKNSYKSKVWQVSAAYFF
ncbi:porin family protein [Bacteroides sp. 51]|uniref:porin family protein n=1 Tax=Bacteroides sp. 51 TaxID=2302938 RepID=UPI0013D3F790|nr:porin family protein [Bacteroides sp. 51]NDV82288.1 porin family protein [Bacteroides sp. 51]